MAEWFGKERAESAREKPRVGADIVGPGRAGDESADEEAALVARHVEVVDVCSEGCTICIVVARVRSARRVRCMQKVQKVEGDVFHVGEGELATCCHARVMAGGHEVDGVTVGVAAKVAVRVFESNVEPVWRRACLGVLVAVEASRMDGVAVLVDHLFGAPVDGPESGRR